ncbi:MAG: hypothetical protein JXR78_15755 [Victivallales bacterium]|nr:hypothetical protein [Victivallales bacterium]
MTEIKNSEQLDTWKNNLKEAADRLTFHKNLSGLELLAKAKFEQCGFNPEKPEEQLNFIEQVNQTFTYMVTYRAVEWLWKNGYENQEFSLNLGPQSGYDIENNNIVAEVFAAVSPSNNGKLKSDIGKVVGKETEEEKKSKSKYVFYTSPEPHKSNFKELNGGQVCNDTKDVTIVYFPLGELIEEYKNKA